MRVPTVTMPARYSARMPATSGGVSRTALPSMRTTSATESTCSPVGPLARRSTMMRVLEVGSWGARWNRVRLSMTGMMRPRRLMTPRMKLGLPGTGVTSLRCVISCTRSMSRPNSTPSRVKVTS